MSETSMKPFSREVEAWFEYRVHQEAFKRLQLVLEHRYLGVLTGEVGSGKSTLVRRLFRSLDARQYQSVYMSMAGLKPKDFYGELLRHAGEEAPFSAAKAKRLWEEVLLNRQSQGERQLVVVIDEAQDLSPAMLLELRFVMNQHMDAASLFPLILVGQPELRKLLKMNKYEAVSQRIGMQYHLTGMNREETMGYIRHQCKLSETPLPVFSESAMGLVFSFSQGIARIVNHLCSLALLEATAKNLEVIEENHIGRILADVERQRGTAG
jgi:type II secretory pathway predicted ATPase ExeA